MAAGDTVISLLNFSGVGYLAFQPAAGVEVVITQTDSLANHLCYTFNGTIESQITTGVAGIRLMKVGISNTNYIRMYNSSGVNVGTFTGIQTK